RHRLDAARAVTLVCEHLRDTCAGAKGVVLATPGYLSPAQAVELGHLAAKAKLPVVASVASPLAAVLAAQAQQPFLGLAFVVDVDDHALTLAAVEVEE